MTRRRQDNRGFTLIELVIVIVIVGLIATVAVRRLGSTLDTARHEQTSKEMQQLAFAIVGNPELFDGGVRTDFGYVGDVGALPPNLEALVTNPGYATWHGPYVGRGRTDDDYRTDAWGVPYQYGDTLLRSTGSGSNIEKTLARSAADLLSNRILGLVRDAALRVPGSMWCDSVAVTLTYPDGAGSMARPTVSPAADGSFSFSGVPVGLHSLTIVYLPDSDTLTLMVEVLPGAQVKSDIVFPVALF